MMSPRRRPVEESRRFENRKVPLYYQLENILREKILSGEWTDGQQLPTESELIEQYRVSRITVRQALASLAGDMLVERIQGRGTYVTNRKSIRGTIRLTGFLEDLMAMGIETKVKTLDFKRIQSAEKEAKQLALAVGSAAWQIKRLRYVKNTPYSYIVNYVPDEIGAMITPADLNHGSLLKLFEDKLDIRLGEAFQTISAALADGYTSDLLQTKVGAPLLSVERQVFRLDGGPVEFVRTLYRADMYCYTVRLTRGPKKTGTGWLYKISSNE